jgi:hypothetical protein
MAEPDRNGISTRLWRLPGELLLALINATAILVIGAAILALVAVAHRPFCRRRRRNDD